MLVHLVIITVGRIYGYCHGIFRTVNPHVLLIHVHVQCTHVVAK